MNNIKFIEGGITAPDGYLANGIYCGIRKNKSKYDLGLLVSNKKCNVAAVYTTNLVKGAPILITKRNIKDGVAQAIIVNSGIANTCNLDGEEKAEMMCQLVAKYLKIPQEDVVVASTGVIGMPLPIDPIAAHMEELKNGLSPTGSIKIAKAIMTTDTKIKEAAVTCVIDGKTVTIGGIAKGSGMIHPNMATMLSFVTTDCNISKEMLEKAMKQVTDETFNMISVDGDTSTNDTFVLMANGLANNQEIISNSDDFNIFKQALETVCRSLSIQIASDGEGATKLIICEVEGAKSKDTAKSIAKTVISSSLVKTAMYGSDANWGRIICAIGYAEEPVDCNKIDVSFVHDNEMITVCKEGRGVDFSEDKALKILNNHEVTILINLNNGDKKATAYGCDLTYDYVKINSDYRS